MEADGRGRVILLNGASSSGKSSIGRALQRVLAHPWFLFPVDSLGAMRSTEHTRVLDEGEIDAMLRRTRLGYHRAVAAVASVGNDVIMDYPLSEPWRLDDLLDVLEGYDVTAVDVQCHPVRRGPPRLRVAPRLPPMFAKWYLGFVSGTYHVVVGDRGRLVVPAEVREHAGLTPGTALVLLETPTGLVLLTREQLRDRVRAELAGTDLVADLLADRRAAAAAEDVA